tara:strand:- start:316 stop:489 length:174 start_codon:yes stop_codon:yes gene_type:complete
MRRGILSMSRGRHWALNIETKYLFREVADHLDDEDTKGVLEEIEARMEDLEKEINGR